MDAKLDTFKEKLNVCERHIASAIPMTEESDEKDGGDEIGDVEAGAEPDCKPVKDLLPKLARIGEYTKIVVGPAIENLYAEKLAGCCKELALGGSVAGWVAGGRWVGDGR